MDISDANLWLLVGTFLLVFEFVLAPQIGFLFLGIGALTTGILFHAGIIDGGLAQWITLLAGTILSALLLWKPLKNWRTGSDLNFNDMRGDDVKTVTEIVPGKTGKAIWNGAHMKARLEEGAEKIAANTEAEIVGVDGNILIIK